MSAYSEGERGGGRAEGEEWVWVWQVPLKMRSCLEQKFLGGAWVGVGFVSGFASGVSWLLNVGGSIDGLNSGSRPRLLAVLGLMRRYFR